LWCENRAIHSKCVLIIASQGWFDAYNGTNSGDGGRGVAAEASLFRQTIYDQKGNNEHIRLVFLEPVPADIPVPQRLRTWQTFSPLSSDTDLDRLVKWLANRLDLEEIKMPTVRWPELPHQEFKPNIADRHLIEWPAIRDMLAGKSPHRLLLVEAKSGYGKSELLQQSKAYAEQIGISVCHLDFRMKYSTVQDLLGQIATDLGSLLPKFSETGDKRHLFIKDLRALRKPVLFLLDTFEEATGEFRDWVCQSLFAELGRARAVAVLVAGQPPLPAPTEFRWQAVARHLPLGPITEPIHWQPWIDWHYPHFRQLNVEISMLIASLVLASAGVPKTFSELCKTVDRGMSSNS